MVVVAPKLEHHQVLSSCERADYVVAIEQLKDADGVSCIFKTNQVLGGESGSI